MHPTRAARLMATLGIILLLVVIGLRGFSIARYIMAANAAAGEKEPAPANSAENLFIPAVSNYTFSEDGAQVTFQQGMGDVEAQPWYSMSVDGGPLRSAERPILDLSPFEVRDGKVYRYNGGEQTLVDGTPSNLRVISGVRSPNRKLLAYIAQHPSRVEQLFVAADTGELSYLGDFERISDLDWSPDSKSLAFIAPFNGVNQIFILDHAGQTLQRLTKDGTRKSSPRWSPDGRSIAYLASRGPGPLGAVLSSPQDSDVMLQALGSSAAPRRLAGDPNMVQSLAWITTSQGSMLAFPTSEGSMAQTAILFAVNPRSGELRRIYPALSIDALGCPSSLPGGGQGMVRMHITNSGLLPGDLPIILRVGNQVFLPGAKPESGAARVETVSLLPGEARILEWPINAKQGLVTHVSALANFDDPAPLAEASCAIRNTYLGLPNIGFIGFVLPLGLPGMLLCLPWLLIRRRRAHWAAWAAGAVLIVVLIAFEMRLVAN